MAKLYRLLVGGDDAAFCHKITKALDEGWELYGSPSMTFNSENNQTVCAQAVTKEVDGPYQPDVSLSKQ